jgi:hypothetical protein
MSRHLDYRDLEPLERRVALMRAAGMSEAVIGRFIDTDYMTVNAILKRPRVARYLIALESTFVEEIGPSAKHLDAAIQNEARRAFVVERSVMERLFEQKENVRAQLGAATTAQDILDRAGKRAPTKIQTEITHTIDAEALARVAEVLQEHKALDVTPRRIGDGEAEENGDGLAGEEAADEGSEGVYRTGTGDAR